MIMLRHVQAKYFAVAVLFSMLPLKEPVHNALCPTVDHSFPVLSVSSAAITLHGDCEDNGIYPDLSDHSPPIGASRHRSALDIRLGRSRSGVMNSGFGSTLGTWMSYPA
jgi:hypothetical protein